MAYLRFLLLIISLLGFSETLKTKNKLPVFYNLSISAAFIISVLFYVSLVTQVTVINIVILAAGLLLFAMNVIRKKIVWSDFARLPYIMAVIMVFAILLLLKGQRLEFVDDFRHWGRICRSIIENQALPTSKDALIEYTTYPPGAALWVAFVITSVGETTEDWYLIAQAFLMLIMLLPFFQYISDTLKKGRRGYVFLYVFTVLCFSYPFFYSWKTATALSLCPEPLLSATVLASFVLIYDKKAQISRQPVYIIPFVLISYLIKDAGGLFSVLDIALLLFLSRREQKTKRGITSACACAFCLLITFALWQYHVSVSFAPSSASPHSLSMNRWVAHFQSYSASELKQIIRVFLYCTIKMEPFIISVICIILIFICYLSKKNGFSFAGKAKRITWYVVISYAAYLLGMLFVYFFSMEKVNALKAGSYARYLFVAQMYIIGITLIFLTDLMDSEADTVIKSKWSWFPDRIGKLACILAMIVLAVCLADNIQFEAKYRRENAVRTKTLSLIGENHYPDLAVYAPNQADGSYHQNHIRSEIIYDARTTDVEILETGNEAQFSSALKTHNYIMICDIDEHMASWIREKQVSIDEPGIYATVLFDRE